jgi:hypothetical protein
MLAPSVPTAEPSMTPTRIAPISAAGGLLAAAAAGALSLATPAAQVGGGTPGLEASFAVDKAQLRASGAPPALIEKLQARSLSYFRRLSHAATTRTCDAFDDLRWRLPGVAVHGDAHVEQFVVTGASYGLSDFDRAGFGPAVVDLVRYAASLHLACRDAGWPCDAEAAVSAYFDAYRAAIDRPVKRVPPLLVARLRAAVPQSAEAWLRWADGLMRPLPEADERALRQGWPRFVALMRETRPDRPAAFYTIERAGAIAIGVGSALEAKTLIRIAGASGRPADDRILEARVASTDVEDECVSRPSSGGSLGVLMFGTLLGWRLPDVFGFMPQEGAQEAPELWLQSWDRGYRELSIADIRSQDELNELATDAGRQLGGHFWTSFPEPLRGHLRFAQLRALEMTHERARQTARRMAGDALREWEAFRRQP